MVARFVVAMAALIGTALVTPLEVARADSPLGNDLAGEACSASGAAAVSGQKLLIVCGANAVGEAEVRPVQNLPADPTRRGAFLTSLARDVASADEMSCDNLWVDAGNALLGCTLASNGAAHPHRLGGRERRLSGEWSALDAACS